jgi:hypothetical protein
MVDIYKAFPMLILIILICFGCTVKAPVLIESNPSKAKIFVNNNYSGETPSRVFVTYTADGIGEEIPIRVEKDGYEPKTVVINSWSLNKKQLDHMFFTLEPKSFPVAGKVFTMEKESPIEKPPYMMSIKPGWAVVIGISTYAYSGQNGLTNLIFADDDAKSFARILTHLGWSDNHIKLLVNEEATYRNIMIALESWLTKAGSNDQIVLFWAGHGYPDPEDPEKVYFACYDTNLRIPATGFRMDRVRSILEERKTKNVIVFADTCHAGKIITRGNRGVSIVPNIEKMKREQNIPKGWIFMVGADTDRSAIEHSSWKNGAFTHSLIKGLMGNADGYESVGPEDGIVTMGELKAYLNTAMPDETQKILGVAKRPIITTSSGDPEIWNLTLHVK